MLTDVQELRSRLREGPYGFVIRLKDGRSVTIERVLQMSISPDSAEAFLWDNDDQLLLLYMTEVVAVSDGAGDAAK